MRIPSRTLGIAIVVWTGIACLAFAQSTKQGKKSTAASKSNVARSNRTDKSPLPNARGSTLFKPEEASDPPAKGSGKIDPLDWPMWRGPEQNGISRETGLVDRFDPDTGENLLWNNKDAGSINTPVIMNGRLYTITRHEPETKQEQEKVLCLDAETGEELWESRHNVYLSGVPAERVGWSCVVADPEADRVYAQGVNGYFKCLDGATGKEIWSRSMHEQFGLLSTYGGRTNTPALFEDLILVHSVVVGWGDTAVPAHRFIAMDKHTGEVRWVNGTTLRPADTTFGTPVITVLDGERAMVFGSSDGSIWAFQPRTGKPIWNFRMSRRGLNVTPVVEDDVVYASQGEVTLDNRIMGSVVAINGIGKGDITTTNAKWGPIKGITAGKGSPLLVDGKLYIADDGANLYTFDAETGKQIGRRTKLVGTMLSSSPVWADGKIYVMSTGALNVFQTTAGGVKSVFKTRLDTPAIIIGSPAISHGRIYLPTPSGLFCLGKKDHKPQATERPAPPHEKPIGDNTQPAWAQVVPGEVLLKPAAKQQFTVRLFNDHGQFLKESSAQFTLAGPGEISEQGEFTAPTGGRHIAAVLTAKVGELTGTARIRVIPSLPWKFDFNDVQLAADSKSGRTEGEPPVTWVGARYRHKVREVDGERVMVKVTYIPVGTRSQMWMGHDDLHDYTLQADLRASIEDNQMPDMGVIAQRYMIDMMGQSQQLQIRSWPPQVATHLGTTVPFEWKPDVWYTVKFQAVTEATGDEKRVVLRGKVWPRGQKEPAQWTIEAVDETPNLVGSPGFYGDATNAEIYIDNISVTANDQAQASASAAANAVKSSAN
ncbi:MAG: PQQ-binding-like beta-propeller repeat protein [Pirellulales bacterium]